MEFNPGCKMMKRLDDPCHPEQSEGSSQLGSVRVDEDSSTALGMTGHSSRLHSFDALRAMLAIFGVVLHAYYFYFMFNANGMSPLLLMKFQGPEFIQLLCLWIHSFRMPAFFALSG